LILILLIALALLFLYLLVTRPEYIAALFFTITLADINFEVGGISFRAAVGILLFMRTLMPDKNRNSASIFSSDAIFIFGLILYSVLVTVAYDLASPTFIKITGQVMIATYCGYHYFMRNGNYNLLKFSLILSALICLGDLVYTYGVIGSFPVQRMYEAALDIPYEINNDTGLVFEKINHNFFGQTCAMCFVFLLHEYVTQNQAQGANTSKSSNLYLLLLPLMLLGVLMSTSRSSLLGLIGISIYLLRLLFKSGQNAQKAIRVVMIMASALILSFLLFSVVKDSLNLRVDFIDRITDRLIDEPVAVFSKRLGLNYNAQALDAMEWREEASANALEAYTRLTPMEQIFGIGYWGYVVRNLGHTHLPPHNGFLLLLIENGMVGFILYFFLTFTVFRQASKWLPVSSPNTSVIIFIFIYCIGQNGELTSGSTFLFFVTMIAQAAYLKTTTNTLKMQPLARMARGRASTAIP
jgi:hypothetical protein